MRKLLLTLTTALLGLTAAQAAEPLTIKFDTASEVYNGGTPTYLSDNNANISTFTFNYDGKEAVKLTGNFYTVTNYQHENGVPVLTIAPGNDTPTNYTIEGTDDYKLVSYKLVVRQPEGDVSIKISFNGSEEITSADHDVTIEGEGNGRFDAISYGGNWKKGAIQSVEFVLEPTIPAFEDGVTIEFNSTDFATEGTLSNNDTYITKDDPAAKITGGFYEIGGKLGIAPKSGEDGSTYNISANDPESYSVAFFRFVIAGLGNDNINVTYNNVTKTTSDGKIIIEGYASKNDPMSFTATQVGTNHKGIFESALIILVPAKIEEGEKAVSFDDTNANSKGSITSNGYETKNVPRISITGSGLSLEKNDNTGQNSILCIAPASKLGSDDNVDNWTEYTISPVNTEKYRIKSCKIIISGYGANDHINVYYNGTIYRTSDGNITISYPVDSPTAQADEVIADPIIAFRATTANGTTTTAKKGEIASATFVLEAKDNVTTGMETITGVMNSEGEVIWYDLNGRRVENPTNGIFVNSKGKKHIFAN